MQPIKHILFPIDFSERCAATTPYVAAMARKFGAKITLLHVLQPYWYAPMAEAPPVFIDIHEIQRDVESELEQSFSEEFAGLVVERSVEIGDPAEVITQFAHNRAVDLVMMPTHGRGLFRELLLGSVTVKVLRDCSCPVWTSAHVQEPPKLLHMEIRNILCAVDIAPKSTDLLKAAAQFAEENGARLQLMHAIPAPAGWPDKLLDAPYEEALMNEARRSIGEWQKTVHVNAPLCIGRGDVASAVRESAVRHAADLVVIGRGVMNERLGRLRTNACGIIRQSPCPVLSF
jgi:nucleotide-binding universal stress UspA family protein